MTGFPLRAVSKPPVFKAQSYLHTVHMAVLALSLVVSSLAVADRLSQPAMPSALAARSLLLDIAGQPGLLVAVGERGHVLVSADDAESWQQARVPVSVTLTAVHFVDGQQGWAVGHDGVVLHSADGGRSWQLQLDGERLNELLVNHYRALLAQVEAGERSDLNPDDIAFALDDALFARDDGPTRPFLDLYFADSQRGWVIGAYGLILATSDGGQSWLPQMSELDNPDGFHLNAMAAADETLVIAGEAGVLFRSNDLGASWERLNSGYDGPLFSVVGLQSADQFLLSGLRGRVFITSDGGEQWQALETATRSTLNAAALLDDGSVVAVGNGGAVLHRPQASDQFRVSMQASRESFTGVMQLTSGELLLTGQKGFTRAPLTRLLEAGHE